MMGAWVFTAFVGACALLAFTAFAAKARDTRGVAARRGLFALGFVPFFFLHLYFASLACLVRFDMGAHSVPWVPVTALFAIHPIAAAWLWRRVVRAEPTSTVRALPLALGAMVAFAFAVATLSILDLRGRLLAAQLSIEAGRLSYASGASVADEEDNAALIYSRHIPTLERDERYDLDEWIKYEHGNATPAARVFDPEDPELRSRLALWAPILTDVRKASRLPRCRFETPADAYTSPAPSAIPLLDMARAMVIDARVRAARGDLRGAIEELADSARVARHVSEMPSMITAMVSSVMLDATLRGVVDVLSSSGVTAKDLEPLVPWIGFSLAGRLERAIAMEEAFAYGLLGEAFGGEPDARAEFLGIGLHHDLYRAFLFGRELASYRALTAEFRTVATSSVEELARFQEGPEAEYGKRAWEAGILPRLMAWGRAERLITLHAADAHAELVRLAFEAKRQAIDHGRFPTTAAEIGGVPLHVSLEGDGTYVLLRDTRTAFERPLEVRLPHGR